MMINLPQAVAIPAHDVLAMSDGLMMSESSMALLADMVFDEMVASPQFSTLSRSREALVRQASLLVNQKLMGLSHEVDEDNDDIAFGRSDCEFVFRD